MEIKTQMRTRKIEITGCENASFAEFKKSARDAEYAVYKVANKATNAAYEFEDMAYSYKKQYGDKLKFKDLGSGKNSVKSDIYALAREEYSHIASTVLDGTIKNAIDEFRETFGEVLKGERVLATHKRGLPIPTRAQGMKLRKEGAKRFIKIPLLSQSGAKELGMPTSFEVRIKSAKGISEIFDGILNGDYKLADSEMKQRKGKWFLHLSYKYEVEDVQPDESRVMGIDLGVKVAAYMAFNFDPTLNYKIEGGEITHFRSKVEARRNSMLRQSKYCGQGRRGHGRKTLLKPIEKLQGKAANFRDTTNHKYSKYIVEMAVKHDVGVIQMEDLSGISERSKFLKGWSYFDLQQKLKYKAAEKGIKVVEINPEYTSQRCHECGHIDTDNRQTQEEFKCTCCSAEHNADFNAAKNISVPGIEEIIEKKRKAQPELVTQ